MPAPPGMAQRGGPRSPFPGYKQASRRTEFGKVGDEANPYTPTSLEQQFLNELYARFDPNDQQQNIAYHRQWWLSMAFFLGMQWLEWDTGGLLSEKPRPSWKKYYTANKIMPKVLRCHTKLVADEGVARMAPMTTDGDDVNGAKAAEQMFEHIKDLVEYDERRAMAQLWAIICGSGFIQWWWNPQGGGTKNVETDGKVEQVSLGDIDCDSFGPMAIRFPSGHSDLRFMPWAATCFTRSLEYIQETWPDKAKHIVPDVDHSQEQWLEERINAIVGQQGIQIDGPDKGMPTNVRIVNFWSRPTVKYPRGLHGMVANGVPLFVGQEDGELVNPYADLGCPIPIEHYKYIPVPGRFFGSGLVEHLIPPQAEYNTARSQQIENKELMSRPKWLVAKGHGIPKNGITSRPGEVIEYNPTVPKPEQVDVKPLPTWVTENVNQCEREMQDIAAQQDVTEAKAPASIRSGIAIQLLQGADNTALGYIKRAILKTDQRSYRIALQIVAKKYTEPRMIQVLGKDMVFKTRALSGADLRGHTNIRIFAESGLLDSKAARQQNVMDFVETGILDPKDPDEKRSILSSLDVGDVRSYVKERLIDEESADFENAAMSRPPTAGEPVDIPQARDFEDHEVHIKRHNLFRKSVEYRLLPPPQAGAIDAHVAQHQQFLLAQVQAMQAQTASQKGAPGEKGEPSAPGGGNKKPEQGGNEAQNNEASKPGGGSDGG